jgi:hypothetical protein
MTDEHDRPPIRYIDAERINPFRVLLDLHDHATRRPAVPRPDDVLAELALAAAVVSWWTRWQPMSIHTALRAGADLADITAATGLDPAEVIRRWQRWTDGRLRPADLGRRDAHRCLRRNGRGQTQRASSPLVSADRIRSRCGQKRWQNVRTLALQILPERRASPRDMSVAC